MNEPQPLRVGIVGLSPVGRFLVESLMIRTDFQFVIFQDDKNSPAADMHPLGPTTISNWHRFLSESELKAVLFLDGKLLSVPAVRETIAAGLPVGILPPLGGESSQWDEFSLIERARLEVLRPHHDDPSFRAALQWVRSQKAEPLIAIKLISWVANLAGSESPDSQADWFSQLLWEDLDQLLCLAEGFPQSVFAADFSADRQTYVLIFRFANGLVAHVERRRGSVVPLDIGWTLSNANCGYANEQNYIQSDDGEVYDVPAEVACDNEASAVRSIRNLIERAESSESIDHVINVLNLQESILESAKQNEVIALHLH